MSSDKFNLRGIPRAVYLAAIAGVVLGVLWLLSLRFVLIHSDDVHYHANFALYINGAREEFKGFSFYEEAQSCVSDESDNPRARVHMHGNINHVVHVHDNNVTWGHFFANLGYGLADGTLITDKKVYRNGASNGVDQNGQEIDFILNGEKVSSVANRVINNEDVLIIAVYENIGALTSRTSPEGPPKDAADYNNRQDPASCSGGKPLTLRERLRQTLRIGE